MSYFKSHWRGEFSLSKSFWINTVLIGILFQIPISFIIFYLLQTGQNDLFLRVMMVYEALYLALIFWQGVGVFRSISIRLGEKDTIFSFMAKVIVVVIATNVILNLISMLTNPEDVVDAWQSYATYKPLS